MERHRKQHGRRLDYEERLLVFSEIIELFWVNNQEIFLCVTIQCQIARICVWDAQAFLFPISIYLTFFLICRRKKESRKVHENAKTAKKLRGIKAKLYNKKRFSEKVQMRKLLVSHAKLVPFLFIFIIIIPLLRNKRSEWT